MNKFCRLTSAFRQWFSSPFFGFVQGHDYLTQMDLRKLHSLVGVAAPDIVSKFEREFASLIGDGRAVSFASGRMGFYALLKILGIGRGQEVVVQGATCAVMVNAVLRAGASPVFADIDPETFGSSPKNIQKCLTPRTRMIVAQHSFGIPCDINPIVTLARSRKIFLLEDSALALGSSVDGVAVGNFGDASLFSTDHSKPLNTMTGGLVYTCNTKLADKLIAVQATSPDLPIAKQQALWKRFLIERRYCRPARYGRLGVIDLIESVRSKLFKRMKPFLSDDSLATPSSSYPYPAKFPGFLAAIGMHEINRWPQMAEDRKELLRDFLAMAENSKMRPFLPTPYWDKRKEIVPLRFVWSRPEGASTRDKLSRFLHVAWTWFLQPIIATAQPLKSFGYKKGSCPIAERIGPGMVNIPCNLSRADSKLLIGLLQTSLSDTAPTQGVTADASSTNKSVLHIASLEN